MVYICANQPVVTVSFGKEAEPLKLWFGRAIRSKRELEQGSSNLIRLCKSWAS